MDSARGGSGEAHQVAPEDLTDEGARSRDVQFIVETPDDEVELRATGPAADYLLDEGHANAAREPHWHLRWCLDRMTVGEEMQVGEARVFRIALPG